MKAVEIFDPKFTSESFIALFLLYLIILGNYAGDLLGCRVQEIFSEIALAKHMIGIDENTDIEIVEYPLLDKKSFTNSSENSELELILELMPDNIRKELNQLNIIPILRNEKLYFILPYHIDIN